MMPCTISGSVPLYLSPVVGYHGSGSGQQNLSATAIAFQGTINRLYCLLALGAGGVQGITANGAPMADLAGCNVKSNTSATCHGHDLGANVRIKAERFPTPTYEWAAEFAASHEASIQYPG